MFRYFQIFLGTYIFFSIFGYFWVFLGIFGYFWVLLGIFGYFWVLYCIDIVPILILSRYCIDILSYHTALGEEIFCLSYPDARDCCPLGLVYFYWEIVIVVCSKKILLVAKNKASVLKLLIKNIFQRNLRPIPCAKTFD